TAIDPDGAVAVDQHVADTRIVEQWLDHRSRSQEFGAGAPLQLQLLGVGAHPGCLAYRTGSLPCWHGRIRSHSAAVAGGLPAPSPHRSDRFHGGHEARSSLLMSVPAPRRSAPRRLSPGVRPRAAPAAMPRSGRIASTRGTPLAVAISSGV